MLSSPASSNLSLTFSPWRVGLHRIKFDEIGFHSTQFLSTVWSLVSQQLLRRSRFKTSSTYWNILFFRLWNVYQLSKMAFQRVWSFPMFRLRLEDPPVWESRRCWSSVSCFLGRDTSNLKKKFAESSKMESNYSVKKMGPTSSGCVTNLKFGIFWNKRMSAALILLFYNVFICFVRKKIRFFCLKNERSNMRTRLTSAIVGAWDYQKYQMIF